MPEFFFAACTRDRRSRIVAISTTESKFKIAQYVGESFGEEAEELPGSGFMRIIMLSLSDVDRVD